MLSGMLAAKELTQVEVFRANPITELAFKQIKGVYWYAAYGTYCVVMMKDIGYINATKLCRLSGKDYGDWSRLKGSQELIRTLESIVGSTATKRVYTFNETEEDKLISGTYCHPDLIPTIACWASTDFKLKVYSPVVNECVRLGKL